MTIVSLIVLLVIAAIAGSIGQALAGYSLGGCLVSTVVGFIGAFLGLWLARQFGLPEFYTISVGGETFPVDHWLFYLCPDGGFANERQKKKGEEVKFTRL